MTNLLAAVLAEAKSAALDLAEHAESIVNGDAVTLEESAPNLTDEALGFLENTVAPAFDIPPVVIDYAKGLAPAIDAAAAPLLVHALSLVAARIDGVLGSIEGALGAPAPAAPAALAGPTEAAPPPSASRAVPAADAPGPVKRI